MQLKEDIEAETEEFFTQVRSEEATSGAELLPDMHLL
jgi:hypothetical protein